MNPNYTAETLQLMKSALGAQLDGRSFAPLQKAAVGVSGNIIGYDLMAPAKLLIPFLTPVRNSLPRRSRAANPGNAANWKVIQAISDQGFIRQGYVNEGARAGQITFSAADKSAAYRTLGLEDALTFEAESAAQGFEDANALATFLLLEQMMVKEEMTLKAGNYSLTLGTPTTPTASASGSGATLTAATYLVSVVALTQEGYSQSSLAGGVATSKQVTGPDGKVSTINGGSSNVSSAASQAVTLGQTLFASTPVVNGAVAYAWFVGTSGNQKLEAITTINSVKFSAPLAGTGQAIAAITGDKSANNGTLGGGTNQVTAFDGLLTTTFVAGAAGNAYVKALATGTAGTGTSLTATGAGTVVEIDELLFQMWNLYKIGPTRIRMNAQQIRDVTKLCLNSASAPLLRINQDSNAQGGNALAAGTVIKWYYNAFAPNGGYMIPVEIDPDLAPGTILFQCEQLPAQFKSNETPTVAEVLTRRDYYRIDWPLTTRERQYGVYSEEVLAVYAPFGFAVLTNIAPN